MKIPTETLLWLQKLELLICFFCDVFCVCVFISDCKTCLHLQQLTAAKSVTEQIQKVEQKRLTNNKKSRLEQLTNPPERNRNQRTFRKTSGKNNNAQRTRRLWDQLSIRTEHRKLYPDSPPVKDSGQTEKGQEQHFKGQIQDFEGRKIARKRELTGGHSAHSERLS